MDLLGCQSLVGKIRFELIHPVERDLQSPATLQLRRLPCVWWRMRESNSLDLRARQA